MGAHQRRKGIDGELEARELIMGETGVPMKRLLQCQKGTAGGDLVPDEDNLTLYPLISETCRFYKGLIDSLHVEVKRTQVQELEKWIATAKKKQPHKTPFILHRRDREDWKITIPADEFFKLFGRAYGD